MFRKFMPREDRFFTYFNNSADLIIAGAKAMRLLVSEMSNAEVHCKVIKDIEHQADDVTHKTVELLHKTFITPFDREDIHQLITKMDDILDLIEAAAERIHIYGITSSTPEMIKLVDICVVAVEKVKVAIDKLENMKKPDEILSMCIEINKIENEGDTALRSAMAKLFKEETDTKQLIKLKEIYEILESVTDRCEDVANIIEGIVLEYS